MTGLQHFQLFQATKRIYLNALNIVETNYSRQKNEDFCYNVLYFKLEIITFVYYLQGVQFYECVENFTRYNADSIGAQVTKKE